MSQLAPLAVSSGVIAFLIVHGVFALFRPDLFWRLYDLYTRGDYVTRNPQYRQNLSNNLPSLGIGCLLMAVVMLVDLFYELLR
jgi:hypothetical protein